MKAQFSLATRRLIGLAFPGGIWGPVPEGDLHDREEAARVFYHADRFTRQRAMPSPARLLQQDKGSVQLLDGDAHRWRKQMFMALMTPAGIRQPTETTADQWCAHVGKWETMNEVVLLHEVQDILCRAVCKWAGVPLTEGEARQRTREFGAIPR